MTVELPGMAAEAMDVRILTGSLGLPRESHASHY